MTHWGCPCAPIVYSDMTDVELRYHLITIGWKRVTLAEKVNVRPFWVQHWVCNREPIPKAVADYVRAVSAAVAAIKAPTSMRPPAVITDQLCGPAAAVELAAVPSP